MAAPVRRASAPLLAQVPAAALVLALAHVAAGCAPDLNPQRGFQSGTRLRARTYRTAEGNAVHTGWWDSQVGLVCAFRRAADGVIRCLPSTGWNPVFADPACTVRAHLQRSSCGDAPRALLGDPIAPVPAGLCTPDALDLPGVQALRVGAREPGGVAYARAADGSCAAAPTGPGFDVYPVTELAPDIFLAARETREARGPRLQVRSFVAEDGAREAFGLWDTRYDASCERNELSAGRCAPIDLGYADVLPWRGDAACTRVIGHGLARTCAPVRAIARLVRSGCGTRVELRTPGPEVPSDSVFEPRPDGGCEAVHRPEEFFYELGPEVPDDAFEPVEVRSVGTSDVRVDMMLTRQGEALRPTGAMRDARGVPCAPLVFADRTTRCVPADAAHLAETPQVFADAACTERVFGFTTDPMCPAPLATHAVEMTGRVCGVDAEAVYPLEPLGAGPRYTRQADACVPYTGSENAWVRVGARVEPNPFPVLSLRTE